MIRRLLPALALVILTGCATPGSPLSLQKEPTQICGDLQGMRDAYATIRTVVANRLRFAVKLCKGGVLDGETCGQLHEDIETAKRLDFEITKKLENPRAELDTDKLLKLLEISAKLVGAVM